TLRASLVAGAVLLSGFLARAETRDANAVFRKWLAKQSVRVDNGFAGYLEDGGAPALLRDPGAFLESLAPRASAFDMLSREERLRFVRSLLTHQSPIVERLAWFALGNRLFEYAFGSATHSRFRALVEAEATRPLARLAYEWIWYALARNGWAHWHE